MKLTEWIHLAIRGRRSRQTSRPRVRRRDQGGSVREGSRARGAAIVEFAVVLPLLLTILFGIIEYGWVFMVRQTLQTSAREGARIAILQTSTDPYTAALSRIADIMQPTGLTTYSPTVILDGTTIKVEVSVPYNDVSLLGGFFGTQSYPLKGACSMRKEGM